MTEWAEYDDTWTLELVGRTLEDPDWTLEGVRARAWPWLDHATIYATSSRGGHSPERLDRYVSMGRGVVAAVMLEWNALQVTKQAAYAERRDAARRMRILAGWHDGGPVGGGAL